MTFQLLNQLSIRQRLLLLTPLTSGVPTFLWASYTDRMARRGAALIEARNTLAMTAHAMAGDAERFLAAGMDGMCPSPFSCVFCALKLTGLRNRKSSMKVIA